MVMTEVTVRPTGAVPRLSAVTRVLRELPDLLAFANPESPLYWNRGDRGCVGVGEVLRLSFTGADRFVAASRAWREIAAAAVVDDPVGMPGTGLVAFGTFAFADDSAAESVLIVPRLLIHRHRGTAWVTEVTAVSNPSSGSEVGASALAAGPEFGRTAQLGAGREAAEVLPAERELDAATWAGVEFLPADSSGVRGAAGGSEIEAYLAGVREATDRVVAGELEKVVLSRQVAGELRPGQDLRVPLQRLSERYLDCWTFAVDNLVGASPETLVRSTSGAVSARVLAGTRARHPEDAVRDRAARDELLRSAKEQHEHDFAVQSVVSALAPHVSELRTSDAPFALQLPNVWHLATDLGAALGAEATALELVDALHPTAAVAGTPTVDAVAMIAELEPFDRGRYSGAVGWIDAAGDGEWVIALRCAQLDAVGEQRTAGGDEVPARRIVATAGGGIVEGSDPQHELGETVSKFRPITEAFGA
ncbi:isochorismate synthase [Leucobacter aridicollis]|uniref:isochorismate synthase n=1 Tax=Leucobacter aridicollis TaxID=283878 RepID=UPI0021075BDA|nr:chorismate-binding protein [Leucobacter aridicollis]